MKLYRDIIEYAESRGISASCKEEAIVGILKKTEEEGGTLPLHQRGKRKLQDFHSRYIESSMSKDEWQEKWEDRVPPFGHRKAEDVRAFTKRIRTIARMDARLALVSSRLGVLSLEDCDAMATQAERDLVSSYEAGIGATKIYPDVRMKITAVANPEEVKASYERMRAWFSVTREALMSIPCTPAIGSNVILHARHVANDVWSMRWASMKKRKKEFEIVTGAYTENVLVIGFPTEAQIKQNIERIQKVARQFLVTKALRGK